MKSLKRFSLLIFLMPTIATQVNAQDDLDDLLQENIGDARKLVGAYISPFMKSISSSLNQGWYNTAKPHKIAGVDLTITVNAMSIPKDELFYNPAALDLEHVRLSQNSPGYPNAPTIFGTEDEPVYEILDDNGEETGETFNGPPGIDLKKNIGLKSMPVPMAQLGFGLPKGFDIKFRFVPKIKIGDDAQLNMFGIGVMHDVKQWIPVIKNSPFDLSGFVGFTTFKLNAKFDNENTEDGRGIFTMNATTIQGVISKKISVLTLYGGLGYNIAKSNLAMLGTYTIEEDPDGNPVTNDEITVKDPLDLKFGSSGPRMTAGFRLKLAVITLHTDYTLQKYSCLTVGFGISVR